MRRLTIWRRKTLAFQHFGFARRLFQTIPMDIFSDRMGHDSGRSFVLISQLIRWHRLL